MKLASVYLASSQVYRMANARRFDWWVVPARREKLTPKNWASLAGKLPGWNQLLIVQHSPSCHEWLMQDVFSGGLYPPDAPIYPHPSNRASLAGKLPGWNQLQIVQNSPMCHEWPMQDVFSDGLYPPDALIYSHPSNWDSLARKLPGRNQLQIVGHTPMCHEWRMQDVLSGGLYPPDAPKYPTPPPRKFRYLSWRVREWRIFVSCMVNARHYKRWFGTIRCNHVSP